jgi:hypothetical protein
MNYHPLYNSAPAINANAQALRKIDQEEHPAQRFEIRIVQASAWHFSHALLCLTDRGICGKGQDYSHGLRVRETTIKVTGSAQQNPLNGQFFLAVQRTSRLFCEVQIYAGLCPP